MGKIFENLKSIFIVEDDKSQPSESKKTSAKSEEEVVKPVNTPEIEIPLDSLPEGSGKVSSKFTEILFKALEKNNQEGFDYIEFKKSLNNLAKMNLEGATAYKSAYAAAQPMGATLKGLIDSANLYLKVLQEEEAKFEKALGSQRAKHIDQGKREIHSLQSLIAEKEAQISQIKKEISQHAQDLETAKTTVKEAAMKVEKTRLDFVASYQNLVDQISTDVEKIKEHIK